MKTRTPRTYAPIPTSCALAAGVLFAPVLRPSSPWQGAIRAWGLVCTLLLLIGLGLAPAVLAVPPGTIIDNTAQADFRAYGIDRTVQSNAVRLVTTWTRTPSAIELLQYAPSVTGAETVSVPLTDFDPDGSPGGATKRIAAIHAAGSTQAIELNAPVPLIAAVLYHQGEPVFVRVQDTDQNIDRSSVEHIWLLVSVAALSESELLLLSETGPDTGIFVGYIQSHGRGPVQAFNGVLDVVEGQSIEARYTDIADPGDAVAAQVPVDPFGLVFDSSSGVMLDGVELTLIDIATGQPARVMGDDGISTFPATIASGRSVTDGSGKVYDFGRGRYRFPFVRPGQYRLLIQPPAGYQAPSTVATPALQELPGGPFVIAEPGSRGEAFVLNPGPAVRIDIPVDPAGSGLWVRKTVNRETAAIGDFVQYRVFVENNSGATVHELAVIDRLPLGFRYRSGSARLAGRRLANPEISNDGRRLTFHLDELAHETEAEIRYVVEVAAGAKRGKARNLVQAMARGGLRSNTAEAVVTVTEDLFRSESIIVGRVIADNCTDAPTERADGVKGVRLYLEDGTYVITDEQGMYHFEGIKPGTHVIQLDLESLPTGFRIAACESNTRSAGRAFSRFVDVQGGTLWREDFHVQSQMADPAPETDSQSEPVIEPEEPPRLDLEQIDLEALTPGFAWVMPDERFQPAISTVKLAVQHALGQKVELLLEDKPVGPLSFEGIRMNAAGTVAVSRWSGVGIEPGENRFTAILRDRSGKEIGRLGRTIYFAGQPVTAELVPERSRPVANGRDAPVIAVRLRDQQGRPARFGIYGEYNVLSPHEPFTAPREIKQGRLNRSVQDKPRYMIGRDGIARIPLAPTTQSGYATLRFPLEGQTQEIRLWLEPEGREWILVGLAEGTAGYNNASGNLEHLEKAGQEEEYYRDGRLAFFAKGRLKGKWLLTAAYDSSRDRHDPATRLFQTLDPDTYYTLYGDATAQQYEASSIRKLYLKIEREHFYALFGDYTTGLTVTELSRYDRRFNGLKSEYDGEKTGLAVFATQTGQAFVKDEIRGDGTSGLYRLSRGSIVINSEKVVIETRDRFRSERILASRPQSRHIDYNIDYGAGTLFFKMPIHSRDEHLNPIFIVVEYETDDPDGEDYIYGGRGAVKLFEGRAEIGLSAVHESPTGSKADLQGLDARIDLGHGVELRAETAMTERELGGEILKGRAHLAELSRRSATLDGRVYYRELGEEFGLGQQNGSEIETRKIGADAAWRLSEQWGLTGEFYRQYDLATDAERDLGESRLIYSREPYQLFTGLRTVEERFEDGGEQDSTQVLTGAERQFLDKRLRLRATHEQSILGQNESLDFPTRTVFGADYQVIDPLALFAEHEIAHGESFSSQVSRAGLKAAPWDGGEVGTSLGREYQENSDRLFANLGLHQIWQIDDHWFVDGGLDRTQTVREAGGREFDTDTPTVAESEDFTAVSLGGGYRADLYSWTGRLETRHAETEDKWIAVGGIAGEVRPGLGLSAGLKYIDSDSETGDSAREADLRLGLALRPRNTAWILLDRFDFIIEEQDDSEAESSARRVVNNLNLNYKQQRVQVAVQYGAKYVFDTIDGDTYRGYTDLTGLELRYDLTPRWDVGLHTGLLHSWTPGQIDYRTGLSVGYALFTNTWVSLGYNFTGFEDEDFSEADFTAAGPFVKFRMKLDQQSVKEMVGWFVR